MIDLLITHDVVTGVLTVKDSSYGLSGITEARIKINKLGFEKVLDGASSPTITDFLNPSLSTLISVDCKEDDIIDVEYVLLKPLIGSTWSNGSNKIDKTGIYNEAQTYSHIYSNGTLYEIDKNAGSVNTIYTKKPLTNATTLYLAHYKSECAVSLYNIPKLVKALCLSQGDCNCKTCGDAVEKITKAWRYIDALSVTTEYDCTERRKFMKCLKDLFSLC